MERRVNASDVAALVGENIYVTRDFIIEQYGVKLSNKIPEKSREDIIAAEVESKISTTAPVLTTYTNSDEVVAGLVEVYSTLDTENKLTTAEVKSYVEKKIYTRHGTENENHVYEWIKNNIEGKLDSSQKTYGKGIPDTDWRIVGKVDGILHSDGISCVIEIKNRQKRLFTSIPKYEKIQVQMYMYLSGLRSSKIVQHYKGQYSILDMDYDEKCIEFCLSELKEAIQDILEY